LGEKNVKHLPERIRVSVGSAMVLGLLNGILDAAPTTVYLLTYREGKCLANCGFCPQARKSSSRADMLARVTWPTFSTELVIKKILRSAEKGDIQRVCIQALNYTEVFDDVLNLAKAIHLSSNVPISVSCQPLNKSQMKELVRAGVNRVSIALDAATEELFDKVKGSLAQGPYTWQQNRKALGEAVEVFGKNQVSTHLIVGLGETEKEMIEVIQWCMDFCVYPSLFAFTPIPGTMLESIPQPPIQVYRRVQLARYLLVQGKTRSENMSFDPEGHIIDFGVPRPLLRSVVENGIAFQTSGCPGCNRPYYNESPSGPIYNYPRKLKQNELAKVEKQLEV
jgi:biotin synthase-related radical SAM superfamily protein